jgi:hypothetical protein
MPQRKPGRSLARRCIGRYQIECGYPLVGDTLRLCFGLDVPPAGKSIEDLFADPWRVATAAHW